MKNQKEPTIDLSQKTLIATVGLPGSGKSYWAKAFIKNNKKVRRVNRDELRWMLSNYSLEKPDEKIVKAFRSDMIEKLLQAGHSVISDDTNLSPKTQEELRQIAEKNGAVFQIADFTWVPLETCLTRNADRPNPVPEKVIRKMNSDFLQKPVAPYVPPVAGLLDVIICDLDGTLADISARKKMNMVYDASRCDELDVIKKPVQATLKAFMETGNIRKIIFMSGREDKYRAPTLRFLATCGFREGENTLAGDFELHMRKSGDQRNDAIVKHELFNAHVHGQYNPLLVLDDRDQVVSLWRNVIGLTCFQVDYGDF